MVARVGVVTTIGCPYCKKAKAALKEKSVEYTEADLGTARDVLAKVKEATGQTTVPQIFIGGEFIGGASELLQLMDNGQFKSKLSSASNRAFPKSIASLLKEHVAASDGNDKSEDEKKAARLAQVLMKELKWPEREVRGKHTARMESAKDIAAVLAKQGVSAAEAAELLLRTRHLAPATATSDAAFDPSSNGQMFQLTKYARERGVKKGEPLNEHVPWWGPARAAVDISNDLRARILSLYDTHLSADGTAVDYTGLGRDDRYARYVDATAELQKADVSELSRDERMAFFINIYNALIIHGTVELGSPANLLKRLTFFGDACYKIGADTFSANDIEHGILRDNATSPASVGALIGVGFLKKPQFREGDKRRELCVSPKDPRIHFALVCGAKSCPPIKLYTPDNLQEGLQEAAVAFCDGEVTVEGSTVTLSKIFKWYGADFALDDKERLAKIAEYCKGDKQTQLQRLASSNGKVQLKYKEYDWSSNSK